MEVKEILATLSLDPEKVTTVDQFKSAVETDFIRKDQIEKTPEIFNKLAGVALGSAEVGFLRELKGIGVELAKDEISGKKLTDIFKIALPKVKESFEVKISELEKKVSVGSDEKVKILEAEKDKIMKDRDDYKALNQTLASEFSSFKEDLVKKERSNKLNSIFEKSYNAVNFRDGMTPIDHKGFKADLNDNYKFDIDDAGILEIRDASGRVVMSPKKTGTPATLDEILIVEAEKNNLIKKVVGRTGVERKPNINGNEKTGDDGLVVGGRLRKINYEARENRAALK